MTINIKQVRSDTLGVSYVNHLLSAGASLMPQVVVDAVNVTNTDLKQIAAELSNC